MRNTESLNVYRLDAELKARVVADADEREVSLNDVVVGILADHFSVRFEPTGRRSPGANTAQGPLNLRVPEALWRKVDAAAARRPKGSRSKVAVVEAVLRDHYARLDRAAA